MNTVYANQNEALDHLCHRYLGQTQGITEAVLAINPGLAELGPLLPEGTPVKLPNTMLKPQKLTTLQLWV